MGGHSCRSGAGAASSVTRCGSVTGPLDGFLWGDLTQWGSTPQHVVTLKFDGIRLFLAN